MKAVFVSMFTLAALIVSALPVQAQRVQVQPKEIRVRPVGGDTLLSADAVEKLKFTAEQKDKYAKIETDYRDKVKAAQEKYRTDVGGDRTKAKEAAEALRNSTTKAREDELAKIEPLLDADQKKLFAQIKLQPIQPGGVRPIQVGGAGINPLLPPAVQNRLQLTDEQKKQVEAIQKEVEAKLMKVLTDEQKKMLEQLKKGPGIRPQPIQPVPQQVRPAVRNADPALPNPRQD